MKIDPQKLECKPVGDITLHLNEREANDLAILVRLKQLEPIKANTLNYPAGFLSYNISGLVQSLRDNLQPTYKK